MTRQIVLDTETTGLEVGSGHRVIEIGCVELIDRRPSGRTFQRYLNPERTIDAGAVAVHGITDDFLRDKPRFAEIADDFVSFIDGAEVLIHNAAFDTAFINDELKRAGAKYGRLSERAVIVDTLELARRKYPGQKNTLDALCKRLGVDNSRREVHGALLDAHLLSDVWIAMTAGQAALALGVVTATAAAGAAQRIAISELRVRPRVVHASATEAAAHALRLDTLDAASGEGSLWRRLEREAEQPA